jgi:hypothetical protein
MASASLIGRCVVLIVSVAMAMPRLTTASFVGGGGNPACTHMGRAQGKCGSRGDNECELRKWVCRPFGSGTKVVICDADGGSDACDDGPGGDCTDGQHNASTNSDCEPVPCSS